MVSLKLLLLCITLVSVNCKSCPSEDLKPCKCYQERDSGTTQIICNVDDVISFLTKTEDTADDNTVEEEEEEDEDLEDQNNDANENQAQNLVFSLNDVLGNKQSGGEVDELEAAGYFDGRGKKYFMPIVELGQGDFGKFRFTKIEVLFSRLKKINPSAFEGQSSVLHKLVLSTNELNNDENNDVFAALNKLPKLESLDLSKNKLKSVPENALNSDTNLLLLDLRGNVIEEVADNAFNNLKNLQTLHLSLNKITKIRKDSFASLSNLEVLKLDYNNIREIEDLAFAACTNLRELDLEYNQISIIGENAFSRNLGLLRLDHNRITDLSSIVGKESTSLRSLYLSHNNVTKIGNNPFVAAQSLELIDLNNNQISSVNENAFRDLNGLNELFLGSNRITRLAPNSFSSLPNLRTLSLEDNKISEIPSNTFNNLPNLNKLELNKNRISTIGQNPIIFTESATNQHPLTVDLSENQLKVNSFKRRELLTSFPRNRKLNLLLNDNQLTSLREEFFEPLLNLQDANGTRLNTISVRDNPFVCSCSVAWIVENKESYDGRIEGMKCKKGEEIRRISDLNKDDFAQCIIINNQKKLLASQKILTQNVEKLVNLLDAILKERKG